MSVKSAKGNPAATPSDPAARLTPAMAQYAAQKKEVGPDTLLLFRIGDFYETFYDDAKRIASLLHLTLTTRDKNSEHPVPLAGIPYHALDNYLRRLVKMGVRVAISEQVEDPRSAKGLVARDIVRIVTPGTLTDEHLLDARAGNFLLAVAPASTAPRSTALGLAWLDLSTGEFWVQTLDQPAALAEALARIAPSEALLPENLAGPVVETVEAALRITRRPAAQFDPAAAAPALRTQLGVASLAGYGLEDSDPALGAAGAALAYARETQRAALAHIADLRRYDPATHLRLDATTLRALEVVSAQHGGAREGSLLAALDRTRTSTGARLLAHWLLNPLLEASPILARQDAIAALLAERDSLAALRERFAQVADLHRILARLAVGRSGPRDLSAVARTLALLPSLVSILEAVLAREKSAVLDEIIAACTGYEELAALLTRALKPDAPPHLREGGVIADGVDPELDRLRTLTTDAACWLADYQARLVQETGINALKIGYNQVFGYYVEVRHKDAARVPPALTRKQTVRDAERYVTPDLQRHQEEVLSAGEKIVAREQELFAQFSAQVLQRRGDLQRLGVHLAMLDVLAGLAELARERRYVRPEISTTPVLHIVDGRHPVLEQGMGEAFVPNDVKLQALENRTPAVDRGDPDASPDSRLPTPDCLMLITGPNMAGKSTYIRQNALLALMTHIGSFLPAKSATVGLTDRIMARVGLSDDIARGASTFMVEMSEAAYILHSATVRSLVILDELGRGTSTYDGLSLAWAVAEHLARTVGCRTLFATHYHELTELAQQVPGVFNTHVAIREWAEKIVFVHRVLAGPTDKSYGLHVARLAGLPAEVIARAQAILTVLEKSGSREASRRPLKSVSRHTDLAGQLPLLLSDEQRMADELRTLDLDAQTPEALRDWVRAWQSRLVQ